MSAEARALLDQLMGGERDVRLDERTGRTKQFSDADVCKFALCGICPYQIFKGTKSDLGACSFRRCGDESCTDPAQSPSLPHHCICRPSSSSTRSARQTYEIALPVSVPVG